MDILINKLSPKNPSIGISNIGVLIKWEKYEDKT